VALAFCYADATRAATISDGVLGGLLGTGARNRFDGTPYETQDARSRITASGKCVTEDMNRKNLLIGIGSLVFLVCPATSGPAAENAAASSPVLDEGVARHKGLDEIYRRFSEGYKKLDPAAVANLYTETAAYLVPGTEIEIGRPKILASFTKFFDSVKQRNGRLEISFQIAQRQAEQTMAYDVGIYTLTSFRENGETRVSKGKFMVVAKPDKDGVWRFQVDGFNDLPKPPK